MTAKELHAGCQMANQVMNCLAILWPTAWKKLLLTLPSVPKVVLTLVFGSILPPLNQYNVLTIVFGCEVCDGPFIKCQGPERVVWAVENLKVRQVGHGDLAEPVAPDVESHQVPHPQHGAREPSLDLVEPNVKVLEILQLLDVIWEETGREQ